MSPGRVAAIQFALLFPASLAFTAAWFAVQALGLSGYQPEPLALAAFAVAYLVPCWLIGRRDA